MAFPLTPRPPLPRRGEGEKSPPIAEKGLRDGEMRLNCVPSVNQKGYYLGS